MNRLGSDQGPPTNSGRFKDSRYPFRTLSGQDRPRSLHSGLMDQIGLATALVSLGILGLSSVLTLAVQQLGWPKWLVRHFHSLREPEIRSTVAAALEEQSRLRREQRERRRAAIQEAGRYEAPQERVKTLVGGTLNADRTGNPERFAAEVPFFVDFMGASTDENFADECGLILASHLRLNRDELAEFDAIVGIKAGSPLVAAALSRRLRIPLLLYRGRTRARRDVPGLAPYESFDGDRELLDRRLLLVDDSTTGGTMMLDCATAVRACGGEVKGALVLAEIVGRNGRERLSRNGVPLLSVVSIDSDYIAGI